MTIFTAEEKADLDAGIFLKRDKPYLKCYATGKDRPAKPEEIVRQLYLKKLMDHYGYPVERIAVEKPVQFGSSVHEKAADIVVWDNEGGNLTVVRSGDLIAPLIYPECEQPFLRAFSRPDRVHLAQGDVLISSIGMGSIGKISLVVEASNLITVSEVTILRNSEHAPEYLFAYLSSSTGQAQIEREITGATGQQHLLKSKVGNILVPDPPSGIEQHLRELIATAYERQRSARAAYNEAYSLVEGALGLNRTD